MKTPEKIKVTVMIDSDVYHGLRQKVGERGMGNFLSQIIRPHVVRSSLEDGYRELAQDKNGNQTVREWEGADEVIEAENIWRL